MIFHSILQQHIYIYHYNTYIYISLYNIYYYKYIYIYIYIYMYCHPIPIPPIPHLQPSRQLRHVPVLPLLPPSATRRARRDPALRRCRGAGRPRRPREWQHPKMGNVGVVSGIKSLEIWGTNYNVYISMYVYIYIVTLCIYTYIYIIIYISL